MWHANHWLYQIMSAEKQTKIQTTQADLLEMQVKCIVQQLNRLTIQSHVLSEGQCVCTVQVEQ